jgi:hypothetical protein
MVGVTATVSQASLAELDDAMRIYEKMLGTSRNHALHAGKRAVLKSLGAATTVAPQYRDYEDTDERSRSGLNKKYLVHTKYATPKRRGKALRRSWQGDWRKQAIYARGVRDLKRRPAVRIAMRGLAKESWSAIGRRGRVKIVSRTGKMIPRDKRIMKTAAQRWVKYHQDLGGIVRTITMQNRLRYITKSMRGGQGAVDVAVSKAARAMLHTIDNKLDGAATAAGLI